jgi:hypothetical protein
MPIDFNHWGAAADALPRILAQMVEKGADAFVWGIQEHIHINGQIDTGAMVGSVHKEESGDPLTKEIHIDVPYWIYQDQGTRFLPARPFVAPGCEEARPVFEEALSRLDEKLTEAVG